MGISILSLIARPLRILGLAGSAVILTASPSLAATMTHQTGSIGSWAFNDTTSRPLGKCTYEGAAGTFYFNGMKIRGGLVTWPDQSPGPEHGHVVLKVRIEHWNGSSWDIVKVSDPVKVLVHDSDGFVQMPDIKLSWPGPDTRRFRGGLSMKWVNPGGSVEGRGVWYVDYHRDTFTGGAVASCKATHSNVPG